MSSSVIAIGGTEDHIHLLVSLSANVPISCFVKRLKGKTSFLAGKTFRWQGPYSVKSVTRSHVARVVHYIENQRVHHSTGRLMNALENIS